MSERLSLSGLNLDVTKVRKDQEGHEKVCAERYARINDGMDHMAAGLTEVKADVGQIVKIGWSIVCGFVLLVLAVCGFLFQQTYKPAPPAPVAVAVSK